jgi:hypothetical protein
MRICHLYAAEDRKIAGSHSKGAARDRAALNANPMPQAIETGRCKRRLDYTNTHLLHSLQNRRRSLQRSGAPGTAETML